MLLRGYGVTKQVRVPTYLDAGHSWDTPSKECFHGCLLALWGWFCSIEAVLSDEVDESRLELLQRFNGA